MALHGKQLKAVELMVYTDMNVTEIARALDISRTTFYNWVELPEFKEKLDYEIEMKMKMVRKSFQRDSERVYQELYDIVIDKDTSPSDKIKASTYILDRVYGKPISEHKIDSSVNVTNEIDDEDILSIFDDKE